MFFFFCPILLSEYYDLCGKERTGCLSSLLAMHYICECSFVRISVGIGDTRRSMIMTIQYNLNASNTNGSFTVDDSNSFQSLQNSYNSSRKQIFWDFFSYFIMELYVVCTH